MIQSGPEAEMHDILRTNDPVLVSFVEALLSEAGLPYHVADENMSIVEGSIGAFPRRIRVLAEDLEEARRLLVEAGLEDKLLGAPAARRAAPDWERR
jgi:hypothetical protein